MTAVIPVDQVVPVRTAPKVSLVIKVTVANLANTVSVNPVQRYWKTLHSVFSYECFPQHRNFAFFRVKRVTVAMLGQL